VYCANVQAALALAILYIGCVWFIEKRKMASKNETALIKRIDVLEAMFKSQEVDIINHQKAILELQSHVRNLLTALRKSTQPVSTSTPSTSHNK
jgi:hypothetical protein